MKRMVLILFALGCMVLAPGCKPAESRDTAAYRRQVERLAAENRRLTQEVQGASAVLNVSNMALVILGGGLAIAVYSIIRNRRYR